MNNMVLEIEPKAKQEVEMHEIMKTLSKAGYKVVSFREGKDQRPYYPPHHYYYSPYPWPRPLWHGVMNVGASHGTLNAVNTGESTGTLKAVGQLGSKQLGSGLWQT